MIDRPPLPDVTAAPIKISGIQRRIQTNLCQPQILCQRFQKVQHAFTKPTLHEIRMDEDCTDFTVLQIEHAGCHGFTLNATQIEMLLHERVITVCRRAHCPVEHLLLTVGTDALMPDRQSPNLERYPGIVRVGSFHFEHFSLLEPCADGHEKAPSISGGALGNTSLTRHA
ncbi:hypothetical protein EMIT0P2_60320 [Pseudomonas sp. IT-P2]